MKAVVTLIFSIALATIPLQGKIQPELQSLILAGGGVTLPSDTERYFCDCYLKVKRPAHWTINEYGSKVWVPDAVAKVAAPCPSSLLFSYKRLIS